MRFINILVLAIYLFVKLTRIENSRKNKTTLSVTMHSENQYRILYNEHSVDILHCINFTRLIFFHRYVFYILLIRREKK